MTVSAVARLMPRPPARVDSRNANFGEPDDNRGDQRGQPESAWKFLAGQMGSVVEKTVYLVR